MLQSFTSRDELPAAFTSSPKPSLNHISPKSLAALDYPYFIGALYYSFSCKTAHNSKKDESPFSSFFICLSDFIASHTFLIILHICCHVF